MTRTWATRFTLVIVSLAFAASAAQAQLGTAVGNWPVPSSNSGSSSRGIRALADVTNPLPFIGVTPCRIVDTRGPAGTFGGPSLPAGTPRNFPLPTGPCAGIPASASAYSLNITVTNTLGPGFIKIYPQGGSAPLVSTLNYLAGQTLANAAIVPAGTSGGVTVVAGASGTDLIIDINGYYGPSPATVGNPFTVSNTSGVAAIIGNNASAAGAVYGVWGHIMANPAGGSSAGVRGENDGAGGGGIGVWGSQNGSGYGVYGTAPAGIGVYGLSTSGYGVYGTAPSGIGALGLSTNGSGVYGAAPSGTGVFGLSTSGYGLYGQSRYIAVLGQRLDTSDAPVEYGLLGAAFGQAADGAPAPWGVFSGGNFGATGAKHFVEPHPGDPKKVILYSSIEGRTVDTYFRGTARFVNREAVIEVPEDFRIVTDEDGLTVQLTPVGSFASMYVESQDLDRIVLKSSKDVQFHYLIQGVRRAFKDFRPVQNGYEFMPTSPDDRMPGHLTAEAKRRLIENGTYKSDGTVNMATAERAGWTKIWADRAREAAEATTAAKVRAQQVSVPKVSSQSQ